MLKDRPHFLIIEPYYGGSHAHFLQGLCQNIDFHWTFMTLPARKWKMRMQLAAPWMAKEIEKKIINGERFDGLLASTFIDLAVLRTILMQKGIHIPAALYFHENQFAYPVRPQDKTKFQFTAINFTSALCADSLAFNSHYNRDTFLAGVRKYINKASDISLSFTLEELKAKSQILHPGFDFTPIDQKRLNRSSNEIPIILWNHRWEHDKNPERFFKVLFELADEGVAFKIVVVGQAYDNQPEIFAEATKRLKEHIVHFGYVDQKDEYLLLVSQCDIVISTAIHEFFGLSVLEAVRAGCYPLVPDRLAYQELFPENYRYKHGQFKKRLLGLITGKPQLSEKEIYQLTDSYKWKVVKEKFHDWLREIVS